MEEQISNVFDLSSSWSQLPTQEPSLIDNVLGRGQKMILTGPSKSCKTALAVQLAISVAEGCSWLENKCLQREVLYLNFSSTVDTILNRFYEAYAALEIEPANIHNLTIKNLRGDMNIYNERKLIEEMSPMILTNRYRLVIIDSIDYFTNINYSETALRLNQALDSLIGQTLGLCVAFVHTATDENESVLNSLCDTHVDLKRIDQSELPDDRFLEDYPFYQMTIATKVFTETKSKVYSFKYPCLNREADVEEYLACMKEERQNTDSAETTEAKSGLDKLNESRQLESQKKIEEAYSFCIENDESPTVHAIATYLDISKRSVYRRVKKRNDFVVVDGILEKVSVSNSDKQ